VNIQVGQIWFETETGFYFRIIHLNRYEKTYAEWKQIDGPLVGGSQFEIIERDWTYVSGNVRSPTIGFS
jgi:hypothetical protein